MTVKQFVMEQNCVTIEERATEQKPLRLDVFGVCYDFLCFLGLFRYCLYITIHLTLPMVVR